LGKRGNPGNRDLDKGFRMTPDEPAPGYAILVEKASRAVPAISQLCQRHRFEAMPDSSPPSQSDRLREHVELIQHLASLRRGKKEELRIGVVRFRCRRPWVSLQVFRQDCDGERRPVTGRGASFGIDEVVGAIKALEAIRLPDSGGSTFDKGEDVP
jgi:hypothetical protein